jgi:micrococcal nuclease
MRTILNFFICLIILSCNRHHKIESNITSKQTEFYSIKKFVDGDTFWVKDGSKKGLKVRLIGVDTPENQARFGKPEEFYGDEASHYTKQKLMNKKVKLVFDKDRFDSFGRTLAYVYIEDGAFLNASLVENGYAEVMTVKPNNKFETLFNKLEEKAKKYRLGIWSRN